MPSADVWALLALAWMLLVALSQYVWRARIRGDDLLSATVLRLMQLYARAFHRVRVEGLEYVPPRDGRPIIFVANHSAGVDPLLIQSALRFEVRWVMGEDMRVAILNSFWELGRVIFVDRKSDSPRGVREALNHLASGGDLGVFPEAHIARPPRHILPFQSGIGLLIRRSGALVIPVIIEGTPQVDPAWASLWTPSRARLRFLPPIDYTGARLKPQQIADDLRNRFAEATGWPLTDRAPYVQPDGRWVYFDLDGNERPPA